MVDNWVAVQSGSLRRRLPELWHAGAGTLESSGAHGVRREGWRSGGVRDGGSFLSHHAGNVQPARALSSVKVERAIQAAYGGAPLLGHACFGWDFKRASE